MAKVTTDIAVELDITARRGDTLKLSLEIRDPITNVLKDLSGVTNSIPDYQAKMTILNSSKVESLSVYSYNWEDNAPGTGTHPADVPPSASVAGHFSGSAAPGCIDISTQTAVTGSVIINIPNTQTKLPAGDYVYDLQVRYSGSTTAEYNTWLFGKLTITADITKL